MLSANVAYRRHGQARAQLSFEPSNDARAQCRGYVLHAENVGAHGVVGRNELVKQSFLTQPAPGTAVAHEKRTRPVGSHDVRAPQGYLKHEPEVAGKDMGGDFRSVQNISSEDTLRNAWKTGTQNEIYSFRWVETPNTNSSQGSRQNATERRHLNSDSSGECDLWVVTKSFHRQLEELRKENVVIREQCEELCVDPLKTEIEVLNHADVSIMAVIA